MKGNYATLSSLAMEVERIENNKLDLLVPAPSITMTDDSHFAIQDQSFMINDFAHGQVANKLSIPKKYYDDMAEIEGLRTMNVNAWLRHNNTDKHYVRTIDQKVRAFLSNAYRPIDNYDVLSVMLPVVRDLNPEVRSCALSDKRMYLQITFKNMEGEVKKGDVVKWGFNLGNSEVGAGAVDIKKLWWRCFCDNGAIGESILRKFHVGSRIDSDNADIFRDDTVKAELESFKLRLRDILSYVTSRDVFEKELEKLKGAANDKIVKVTETVQNVTKRFGIAERFNDAIIENMVNEGNLNRYGLCNGITFLAHSIENPDQQYEMEKIGQQIIDMSRNEWGKFVVAA